MKSYPKILIAFVSITTTLLFSATAHAERKEYDLIIEQQNVNITDKSLPAMTINGGIPGPTLRFTEGDYAVINVHNNMDVETSIHWHGLLLPNQMDGVPNVTYPPIAPGETFHYEFSIRQSGTYWYHSHTSLQEQLGVYGSFVIEPRAKDEYDNIRDHVVLLSDWTDEKPSTVLHTLKRGSEWYSIKKNTAQSILGAASVGRLGDYLSRELQRMPPMDLSDIYYDRFLLNGKEVEQIDASPNEQIRLRIINGSASSFFYLEFSGGPLTIISADGQAVEAVDEKRFLIGVAETYDVVLSIPSNGSYEFRATAQDGSGHTSLWIGNGHQYPAENIPSPNLYAGMGGLSLSSVFALTPAGSMGMNTDDVDVGKFDKPGMNSMQEMDHTQMRSSSSSNEHQMSNMESMPGMAEHNSNNLQKTKSVDHSQHNSMMMKPTAVSMDMNQEKEGSFGTFFGLLAHDLSSQSPLAVDGMSNERPWPPYEKLKSPTSTSLDKSQKQRDIRLTLDGDMERFVWFLNGKPLSESDSIEVKKGEVVRFIMINRTMMHHPMHLHGHFFRVVNQYGDYSPLKHTVNVAPMSTTVIEFNADEFGDWFFHCHLLYHMKSGMARVVHYNGFELYPALKAARPKLYTDEFFLIGELDAMSNMAQGLVSVANSRHIFSTEWKVGWENVDQTSWEATPTYDYYINRFSSIFAGVDLEGTDEFEKNEGVFGLRYLLPLNIRSRTWVDTAGDFQFALGRRLDLTPHIKPFGEFEYDTGEQWEIRAGASYILSRDIALIGQWHSDYGWGGGLQFRF